MQHKVRFGSEADIVERTSDVRFPPESGHLRRPNQRHSTAQSSIALIPWFLRNNPASSKEQGATIPEEDPSSLG
jgi:hypothetical protein